MFSLVLVVRANSGRRHFPPVSSTYGEVLFGRQADHIPVYGAKA